MNLVDLYAEGMDVGVTELRANLSDWLQRVREGEELTITDRGMPVARLVPVDSSDLIERLTQQGVLPPPLIAGRRPAPSRVRARGSVSGLVREQRDASP